MQKRPVLTRERLDGTAVDIEFLLIAVIQGFALATLAVDSDAVIGGAEWQYWPYVLGAFILILNFWSLAIVHSISFISWPFDLVHTLLYFLVAFVEVAAFAQVTHPATWFGMMMVFFLVSALLYAWDLKMIRERRAEFDDTPARRRLYDHILRWQVLEIRWVVPAAIVFQAAVVAAMLSAPDLVLGGNRHFYVILAQDLFGLVYLLAIVRTFAARRSLLTACADADQGIIAPR